MAGRSIGCSVALQSYARHPEAFQLVLSWLASERACVGLAQYRGAALCCTRASHVAVRSLAQPRCRRFDRCLLVTEPGSAVTVRMEGSALGLRPKIVVPGSCFSLKLLVRDMSSAKWYRSGANSYRVRCIWPCIGSNEGPCLSSGVSACSQGLTMTKFVLLCFSAGSRGEWCIPSRELGACGSVAVSCGLGGAAGGGQFGDVTCPR